MVAWNAMQFGLIGLLGGISAGVFASFSVDQPWCTWSFVSIVLVGILGYRQVDLSARVLIVMVALELLIVLIVDAAMQFPGGAEGLSVPMFDFSALTSGSPTAAILFCLGSFIGIEATTIYGEEARDPGRTIPRATYLSVLMIGLFFVITTWLMIAGTGAAALMPMLEVPEDPTAHFFILAEQYTNPTIAMIAGILLVSSLFAALSTFHNAIASYSYVAGREGLLPSVLGRTHWRTKPARRIGNADHRRADRDGDICVAATGPDPELFTWVSQVGTFGVLGMMAVTSLAVISFLRTSGVGGWVAFGDADSAYGDLTGTMGGAPGWILPGLIPLGAVIGLLLAGRLKSAYPAQFARMGQNQV